MDKLSNAALLVASTQIGKEETPRGSNWGHPVQDYLLSVGINFPASWCMAFVYWCFSKAAIQLSIKNPLAKTGGVLNAWQLTEKTYKTNQPQPGSIFILDFGGGLGHTGVVESIDAPKGLIHTIEGNTNDTGSREGYEVCRRVRSITKCKGFITT